MAEVELSGLSSVLANLSQLEPRQTKSIIVEAVRVAIQEIIAPEVRAESPVAASPPSRGSSALSQGFLRSDITTRVSSTTEGAIIGTVQPGKMSRHVATWVASGHRIVAGKHVTAGGQVSGGRSYLRKNGTTKGPGRAVGTTAPNEFVDRAFQRSADAAGRAVEASIIEQLRSKGIVNG